MTFRYVLGLEEDNIENMFIINREAVRAIIINNDEILMINCSKGDYKFPGGGMNKEENHEDTLKREVQEETGYIVKEVREKLGVVIERNLDKYQNNAVFEMISNYYLCEISEYKVEQNLDDYEKDLQFMPKWIKLDEAIKLNEELLKNFNSDKNPWLSRETIVLRELKENFNKLVY